MKTIEFTVPGKPFAKQRARVVRIRGQFPHAFTPKETVAYENLIKLTFAGAVGGSFQPHDGPVLLTIRAYFPLPKSKPKWLQERVMWDRVHVLTRPDWDNVGKIVSDALNGIAYRDDSQITEATVFKIYSACPELRITLRFLDNPRRDGRDNGRDGDAGRGTCANRALGGQAPAQEATAQKGGPSTSRARSSSGGESSNAT